MSPERALRVLRLRARSLFRRGELDRELDEELAYHVDRLTEQFTARGMAAADARRAALAAMDGLQVRKEECRDMRNLRLVEDLAQDARYASRQLRKHPGFAIAATAVLALAIGGNTAMFSVARTVFTPLHIPDADRTVMVWTENPARQWHQFPASMPDVRDWRASGVFASLGAFVEEGFNLRLRDRTDRVEGLRVTPGFFETLSIAPARGRSFAPRETAADHTVLISDRLWRGTFAGNPDIVGQTAILDGTPHTIVGVLPPRFPRLGHDDLYALLSESLPSSNDRGTRNLGVVARLQPGVAFAAAQKRMTEISNQLAARYPKEDSGMLALLQPLQEAYVQDARLLLVVLVGAVACVLAAACANVASLLLARSLSRRRELAIRTALGGGRWRLTRQLLTEHLLLGVGAGVVSLAPAWWAVRLIASYHLEQLPDELVGLSVPVLAFNFGVALLTGVACGVVPAWLAWKHDVNAALKGSPNVGAGRTPQRLRGFFVAGQIAVTVVLLVAGGLMLRSFLGLLSKSPGYDADNVLTMRVALSASMYAAPERQVAFFDRVLDRAASLPGVLDASATEELPTSDDVHASGLLFFGQPEPRAEDVPVAIHTSVASNYFRTMRIPLVRGRWFTRADTRDSAPVAIIDEATARRYWPDRSPLGQRFRTGRSQPWREIVGVVGDAEAPVVIRFLKGRLGQVYLPYAQDPTPRMSLVVRTAGDANAMAAPMRTILREIDPDQPAFRMQTLTEVRAADRKAVRVVTTMLSGFAAIALVLATLGLYGTVAYDVGQRTREFGLRLSLGAQRSAVMALVLGRGARLLLVGVGLGLVAAFASTRMVADFLYGVQANDPVTFAIAVGVLAASGMLAALLPARRATNIDPIVALRSE